MDIIAKLNEWGDEVCKHRPNWSFKSENKDGVWSFHYPHLDKSGFDINVEVGSTWLNVETGTGWHEHIHEPTPEEAASITGLVRDLLSPGMRIRELRAGNGAYRWHLEIFSEGAWHVESTIGLLFWNYLGKRSEQIYQNHHLPQRERLVGNTG